MSHELLTILIGASPLAELRGALPMAIGIFKFSPFKAYILSVLGNIIIIPFVLLFLIKFSNYLMHHSYYVNRFFTWLFERTRRKHTKQFEIWGTLALFIFTAIPLPLTGAWSACAAAFVFGVDFWKAVASIALGVLAAGLIVLAVTLSVINIF
ncbi:MAG: Small multidrug export protein [Parcubacteria group bacterium Athens0714_26]|nr:MAG: Small multidrug export protein [Parcubacteria group bacterium Athens1014_26]TSD02523.1 MAG: Small multidrug export protein [Parcubacteria group bacterium Athens0714_26]